jgi:hypothetical protein
MMPISFRSLRKWAVASVGVAALLILPPLPVARAADFAFTLYAGRTTSNNYQEVVSPNFVDAYLVDGALAWTAKRFFHRALSLEVEGQVAKYFGGQHHWEFNLPVVAGRWHRFPWNNKVATTVAWGIGPSYASSVPRIEQEIHGSSVRWLVYWFAELTLGPPKSRWAMVLRLHHRSTAFGAVAEKGGSNTLALGVKVGF